VGINIFLLLVDKHSRVEARGCFCYNIIELLLNLSKEEVLNCKGISI